MEEEETQTEAIQLELEVALENYRQGDIIDFDQYTLRIGWDVLERQYTLEQTRCMPDCKYADIESNDEAD